VDGTVVKNEKMFRMRKLAGIITEIFEPTELKRISVRTGPWGLKAGNVKIRMIYVADFCEEMNEWSM
jgi:hypothetical protein